MRTYGVILALILSLNLYGKESKNDLMAMLGIGGPLIVLQASASALISYDLCDRLSTELYFGYSGTASQEDESKDIFGGVGFSFFPWGARKNKMGMLDKGFFRLAYSYHRIDQEYRNFNSGTQQNWIEKSHGIEIGVGVRVKMDKYVFEFIPLMVFLPLGEEIDGIKQKKYVTARIVNFKFGVRF